MEEDCRRASNLPVPDCSPELCCSDRRGDDGRVRVGAASGTVRDGDRTCSADRSARRGAPASDSADEPRSFVVFEPQSEGSPPAVRSIFMPTSCTARRRLAPPRPRIVPRSSRGCSSHPLSSADIKERPTRLATFVLDSPGQRQQVAHQGNRIECRGGLGYFERFSKGNVTVGKGQGVQWGRVLAPADLPVGEHLDGAGHWVAVLLFDERRSPSRQRTQRSASSGARTGTVRSLQERSTCNSSLYASRPARRSESWTFIWHLWVRTCRSLVGLRGRQMAWRNTVALQHQGRRCRGPADVAAKLLRGGTSGCSTPPAGHPTVLESLLDSRPLHRRRRRRRRCRTGRYGRGAPRRACLPSRRAILDASGRSITFRTSVTSNWNAMVRHNNQRQSSIWLRPRGT